nr:solute carrier family 35 member G1-like [Dermatophagoides farinae]
MKNGHQTTTTTTTAASTTTTTTNHQPNGDFRMLPIIEQSSQISNGNGNGNGKQPRNSIHSMTNSQKSNLLNRTKKFLKGICLTILSGLFFSITTLVVKYVKDVSPGTTAGFRYFGIIILSFPLALESPQPLFGMSGTYLWIALRGLAGGTSVFCRYSALHYMSMADSTIIILSMPVFVFVFARIFLKEHFGPYHVLALVMSIVGIIFASKLEIIFGKPMGEENDFVINNNTMIMTTTTTTTTTMATTEFFNDNGNQTMNETNYYIDDNPITKSMDLSDQLIGTLYSLGATFVGCFVYVIIRKLKHVDKYVILFNFSIISMIEMVMIDYFFYDIQLPTTGYTPYLIFLIGILSFYAQLLLTRAIQIEEAGVVSVVRTSSEAFFAFILQIIFFQQIPDLFTMIGAILVLSAVFLLSFRKYIIGLPDNHPMRIRFAFLSK